jgi:hypothetical protein
MSSLAWLAIPLVALLLGVLWAVWTARPRPRADTHETVEEHARFRAALAPRHPEDQPDPYGRTPQD